MNKRRKPRFATVLLVAGLLLSVSCGENNSSVSNEKKAENKEMALNISEEMTGTTDREPAPLEKVVDLAKASEQPDMNNYELVVKDNENYYYFVNRKYSNNHWCYLGKAYVKGSSHYYYRGEVVFLSRDGSSFTIHYKDVRNSSLCLIQGTFTYMIGDYPAGNGIFFHSFNNRFWGLRLQIVHGSVTNS